MVKRPSAPLRLGDDRLADHKNNLKYDKLIQAKKQPPFFAVGRSFCFRLVAVLVAVRDVVDVRSDDSCFSFGFDVAQFADLTVEAVTSAVLNSSIHDFCFGLDLVVVLSSSDREQPSFSSTVFK